MASNDTPIIGVAHIAGTDHLYVLYHPYSGCAVQVVNTEEGDKFSLVAAPFTGKPDQTWVSVEGVKGYWWINEGTGTYLAASGGDIFQVKAMTKCPTEWSVGETPSASETQHIINLSLVQAPLAPTSGNTPKLAVTESGEQNKKVLCLQGAESPPKETEWVLRSPEPSNPSDSYINAPERVKIINNVHNAVEAIKEVLKVLDNPKTGDAASQSSLLEGIKTRVRECAANLELACRTASLWADWAGKRVIQLGNEANTAHDHINTLTASREGLQAEVSSLMEKLKPLNEKVEQSKTDLDGAQQEYTQANNAHEKAKKELEEHENMSPIWKFLEIIAVDDMTHTTVYDKVKNEAWEALQEANRKLQRAQKAFNDDQNTYDKAKAECDPINASIGAADRDIKDAEQKLKTEEEAIRVAQEEAKRLLALSFRLQQCLKAVLGASAESQTAAMPHMKSLEGIRESVQSVLQDLKSETDFRGPLA